MGFAQVSQILKCSWQGEHKIINLMLVILVILEHKCLLKICNR